VASPSGRRSGQRLELYETKFTFSRSESSAPITCGALRLRPSYPAAGIASPATLPQLSSHARRDQRLRTRRAAALDAELLDGQQPAYADDVLAGCGDSRESWMRRRAGGDRSPRRPLRPAVPPSSTSRASPGSTSRRIRRFPLSAVTRCWATAARIHRPRSTAAVYKVPRHGSVSPPM
jgi:hypothetical protein